MRILYVHATFVPPPTNQSNDRFFLLSEVLEGDVLQPVWLPDKEAIEATFGPGSYPVHTVGRFRYHWCFAWRYQGIRQRLHMFWFYLTKGWELCRTQRYDCIIAYSHMTTGLMAGVLKLLTRTKLIIEIATSPPQVYLAERPRPGFREKLMHAYSDVCLHLSMWMSDRAHCLYPGLFTPYPLLRNMPNSVFHEFVTVSMIDRYQGSPGEPFILLVGAPWFLKGADLLIAAFQRLAPDFPDWKLKIMGYYPDRAEMDAMIGNTAGIEILEPRPNVEAVKFISQASILVLASRCEGMGRVLIEGMAGGVPVVGSTVGGIPHMIEDGKNGRLFTCGDSRDLELRLRELMASPELRKTMGDEGYRRAHTELNEAAYVKHFAAMVHDTMNG